MEIDIDLSKIVTGTLSNYPSCTHLQSKFEVLLQNHFAEFKSYILDSIRIKGIHEMKADYEKIVKSHKTHFMQKDWSKFNVLGGGTVEEYKAEREVELHFFQTVLGWITEHFDKDGNLKPTIKPGYCCPATLKIMEELVRQYEVTQIEVRLFEDFFTLHQFTNLDLGNQYRDKTTEFLDFERLTEKIFQVGNLFEREVQDYFFACYFEDGERENMNRHGETDFYILKKKIEMRRKSNHQKPTQIALALSYFYQHESGELPMFTTTGKTKTAEIEEIADKHKVGAKNFEMAYNRISKRQSIRLSAAKISDFVNAIQLLSNSPEARRLAIEELEQKKSIE